MSYQRLARPQDAPQIHAIYAPVVRDTPISFEYEVPTVQEMAGRISKVLERRPWLVHEQDGVVLAYAYATSFRDRAAYDWGVEVSIYVHRDAQHRGIGRALYAQLFEVLRALNYCQAVAGATLPNPASERLHESMGFHELGRYPAAGYKFGRWHDVIFWYRQLRQLPAEAPPIVNINELIQTNEWAWLTGS